MVRSSLNRQPVLFVRGFFLSCVTILVTFTSSNDENIVKFKVKDVSQRF